MLTFFGRGSAFCKEHNSAFFRDGKNLVLIDFPMSSFHRLRDMGIGGAEHIYVLVTHTHSDHTGGIPMLIHYAYYVLNRIPVTVISPSDEIGLDLDFFINRLDGCDKEAYEIITAGADLKWIEAVIPTKHTLSLDGRCFGYCLQIFGRRVVYTGDTNTLDPFMDYLMPGTILYCEAAIYSSPVHLAVCDMLDTFNSLTSKGVEIFLMHLDNENKVKRAVEGTDIKLAPVLDLNK